MIEEIVADGKPPRIGRPGQDDSHAKFGAQLKQLVFARQRDEMETRRGRLFGGEQRELLIRRAVTDGIRAVRGIEKRDPCGEKDDATSRVRRHSGSVGLPG